MEFTEREYQIMFYALTDLLSMLDDDVDNDMLISEAKNNAVANRAACNRALNKIKRYMKENNIKELDNVINDGAFILEDGTIISTNIK